MITATLLFGFGLTLAPQDVDALGTLPEQVQSQVRVSLQLEETHFAATNFDSAPVLLVIASEDRRMQMAFWLPAGGSYVEDYARGTLRRLQIEVLSVNDSAWVSTGAYFLSDFMSRGSGALWILNCGHVVTRWGEGEALVAAAPSGSLLPPRVGSMAMGAQERHMAQTGNGESGMDALHVPVPTPTDKPKKDKPPRKRHGQLPPV